MSEQDSVHRNEIKDVVEALYSLRIAIMSLNPDPTKTIAEHKRNQIITTCLAWTATTAACIAAIAALIPLWK